MAKFSVAVHTDSSAYVRRRRGKFKDCQQALFPKKPHTLQRVPLVVTSTCGDPFPAVGHGYFSAECSEFQDDAFTSLILVQRSIRTNCPEEKFRVLTISEIPICWKLNARFVPESRLQEHRQSKRSLLYIYLDSNKLVMNTVISRSYGSVLRSMERCSGQCACAAKKSQSKRSKSRRARKTSVRKDNEGFGGSAAPSDGALQFRDCSTAVQSESIESEREPERVLRRQDAFKERSMKPVNLKDNAVKENAATKLERENVLTVCRVTSLGMAAIGILATFATPALLKMSGSGIDSVSQASLFHMPAAQDLAIGIIAGCAITAARFGAMQGWDDLATSTNAANAQVRSCAHPPFMSGKARVVDRVVASAATHGLHAPCYDTQAVNCMPDFA